MKIAVINETSAADRNTDILAALEGRGHEVINAGMTRNGSQPELTYIHTGLMAALLLALKRVDLVVGGCGTGQGFLNSVVQYPGVICGHILTPLDAWLFTRINAGNCISLALNQGYGWAGDINLRLIFDQLFSQATASGYPPHRQESQRQSRQVLSEVSQAAHRPMAEIVAALSLGVIQPVVAYPGFLERVREAPADDIRLKQALLDLGAAYAQD
jgi:ribose 5-phosphate isomerase RpiB